MSEVLDLWLPVDPGALGLQRNGRTWSVCPEAPAEAPLEERWVWGAVRLNPSSPNRAVVESMADVGRLLQFTVSLEDVDLRTLLRSSASGEVGLRLRSDVILCVLRELISKVSIWGLVLTRSGGHGRELELLAQDEAPAALRRTLQRSTGHYPEVWLGQGLNTKP